MLGDAAAVVGCRCAFPTLVLREKQDFDRSKTSSITTQCAVMHLAVLWSWLRAVCKWVSRHGFPNRWAPISEEAAPGSTAGSCLCTGVLGCLAGCLAAARAEMLTLPPPPSDHLFPSCTGPVQRSGIPQSRQIAAALTTACLCNPSQQHSCLCISMYIYEVVVMCYVLYVMLSIIQNYMIIRES